MINMYDVGIRTIWYKKIENAIFWVNFQWYLKYNVNI